MLPNHLFSATPIGPLLPGDPGLPSLSARRTNGGFLSGFQLYTTCPHLLRDLFLLLARQAREKRRNMLMIYIIQTFSIFLSYTSCIVFPFRAILEELILRIGPASGAIFSLLPSRWSNTWVRIDPVQNSVEAALENTHEQERNTIKVKELNLKS